MNPDADQPYNDRALQRRLYTAVSAYQQALAAYRTTIDLVRRDELMVDSEKHWNSSMLICTSRFSNWRKDGGAV